MTNLFEDDEKKDLVILHADQRVEYEKFSEYVRSLLHMDATMLGHCGYKSIEDALVKAAKDHEKKLLERIQRHLKKYPD